MSYISVSAPRGGFKYFFYLCNPLSILDLIFSFCQTLLHRHTIRLHVSCECSKLERKARLLVCFKKTKIASNPVDFFVDLPATYVVAHSTAS